MKATLAKVRRLRSLPRDQRAFLLRAAIALVGIRVGLTLVGYRRTAMLLRRASAPATGAPALDAAGIAEMAGAISLACRNLPVTRCLDRALAMEWFLRRRGHVTRFCIGVKKASNGDLIAHAWLECGDKIVIGGLSDLGQYARLPLDQVQPS